MTKKQTTPAPDDGHDVDVDVIDLDEQRGQRATMRREQGKKALAVRLQGTTYRMPDELPVDTFAPLAAVTGNVGMLVRAAIDAAQADSDEARMQSVGLLVDSIAVQDDLLPSLLSAVRQCAVNLMGQEAFDAFLAYRPSREDYSALASRLFAAYGVSLGEASTSSGSSPSGGTTSKQTSSGGTGSTPEEPTETPETPGSSESVA